MWLLAGNSYLRFLGGRALETLVKQHAETSMDKATADSRTVQSFAIIKNTGHRNFVLAVFALELERNYPSETSMCTVAPFPTDTSSPILSERPYTGYLERIIHLQTVRRN